MVWAKMKNVVLALLLITNLFLGALVFSQEVKADAEEHRARALALAFLGDRGLLVDDSMIPYQIHLEPKALIWSREREPDFAQALLGDFYQESLGGDIVRYFSQKGELRFHGGGEFFGTFPQGSFYAPLGEEISHAQDFLKELDMNVTLLSKEEEGTFLTLTFRQELDGIPLLGCEITLQYQNGSLCDILQGKRLDGEFTQGQGSTITVATALVQCYNELSRLGDVCSAFLSVESSYMVSTPLTSSATLTPVWHILTDTGEYYLSTITGTLDRVP